MPPSAPTSAEKLWSCFEVEQISPQGSDCSQSESLRGPAWILIPTRVRGCLIPRAASLETLITEGPRCTRQGAASRRPLQLPPTSPSPSRRPSLHLNSRLIAQFHPLGLCRSSNHRMDSPAASSAPHHVPVSFYKRSHWPWPLTYFFYYLLIYLAVPGLHCSTWDLAPWPEPPGLGARSQPPDHQGCPMNWNSHKTLPRLRSDGRIVL